MCILPFDTCRIYLVSSIFPIQSKYFLRGRGALIEEWEEDIGEREPTDASGTFPASTESGEEPKISIRYTKKSKRALQTCQVCPIARIYLPGESTAVPPAPGISLTRGPWTSIWQPRITRSAPGFWPKPPTAIERRRLLAASAPTYSASTAKKQ